MSMFSSAFKAIVLVLATIFFIVISLSAIRTYVVQAFKIPSGAMEKTILIGDHVLVDKRIYRNKRPKHGDIVVFEFPKDPRKNYIKRVVAVGGDTLEIRNKKVFVNELEQESDFAIYSDSRLLSDPKKYPENLIRRDNLGPIKIPPGKLFVMGDNRDSSNDSRFWGYVDVSAVLGKAFFIYWSQDQYSDEIRWDRIGESL